MPDEKIELTQAERERFADWLDQQAESDRKASKGLEEIMGSRFQLTKAFELSATYKEVIANQIRGIKSEIIAETDSNNPADS